MCDLQPLTGFFLLFIAMCIGSWIGGWWGWRYGSKWGEAKGIAWSTERIVKVNAAMRAMRQ